MREAGGAKMLKSISTVVTAAAIAGFIVFVTSAAPDASASGKTSLSQTAMAGRQAIPPKQTACSAQVWPYFEQRCLDRRNSALEARNVRIIVLK
jgi:hypothetical protein